MPSAGIVKGKKRAYGGISSFLGEPTTPIEISDKVRPCHGVFPVEKQVDPDPKTKKRAGESLTSGTLREHSVYSTEPIIISSESECHNYDLDTVNFRVRKRRKSSIRYSNTIGKDVCSPTVASRSDSDDGILVRRPPSEIQKQRSRTSHPEPNSSPGPLDHMDLEPSVMEVSGGTAKSKNCLSKNKDHSKHKSCPSNLTTQENSAILYSFKRNAQRNYSIGLKLVESVESDDGQKVTYYWSSSEPESDKPSGSQILKHASTSSKTVSLVGQLRQAAAERSGRVSTNDVIASRKKIRTSTSASSISESLSEYSDLPTRSSTEVSDDFDSGELPILEEEEQKAKVPPASIVDRKRFYVYSPPPNSVLAMIQYVVDTYTLFDKDLEGDDCWLHPFPPASLYTRGHRAIQQNLH